MKKIISSLSAQSFRLNRQWTCINCGSLIFTEVPCCGNCFLLLNERTIAKEVRTVNKIPIYSLFSWNPKESDSLSNLILYLKRQPENAWKLWAQIFSMKAEDGIIGPDSVLIPCPNRTTHRLHSQHLARTLGEIYSCEVVDCLEYISGAEATTHGQHNIRGRQAVSAMRMKFVDTAYLRGKELIFVDDVITTGTTLFQANLALRPLQISKMITFANRGKLAVDNQH